MSENLKSLFVEADKDAARSSVRSLAGTAQLTALSTEIANNILKAIESNLDEYEELFTASKTNQNAMDTLISSAFDLASVDLTFIKELDEETVNGMLKSQQSKRSRAKKKPMTMDNYKTMLVGAIGEQLIRVAIEKPKQSSGRRMGTATGYTEEQLQALAADQNLLRKEIRNLQSRKSIMKSKDDFDENSDAWKNLLEIEESLKAIRTVIKPDTTKAQLVTLLADVDISQLKAAEAKALLEKAAGILNPTDNKEEETDNAEG